MSITARQIVERIQKHVGVPWSAQTVDTFKVGDPDAPVTAVAVTMMATLDVLRRAAAGGHNFVISHEPTFYDHEDRTAPLEKENDPVLAAKKALIARHGLTVFRFHDHWHLRQPDGVLVGMVDALGWKSAQNAKRPNEFRVAPVTVEQLARQIQRHLNIPTLRVVGDPNLRVTKLGLSLGFPGFDDQRHLLQSDGVEALVMGEAHEWETIEYAADAVAAGKRKALIVLGHIPSEQGGMVECARWLKTFVPEVPVRFVPTRDPFWRPR